MRMTLSSLLGGNHRQVSKWCSGSGREILWDVSHEGGKNNASPLTPNHRVQYKLESKFNTRKEFLGIHGMLCALSGLVAVIDALFVIPIVATCPFCRVN